MSLETPVKPDELLTLDEVAALARITKPLAMKYLNDKACPLRKVLVGRYIRVPRSSYDAWLAWLAA
jgi:predicted DNA-binding transcriptional regulator AlpA